MFFFKKPQAAPGMSVNDAIARAEDGTVTLIDVREHREVSSSGKAKDAVHIPLSRIRDMADPRHPDHHPALKKAQTIAVYCASGARSGQARAVLQKFGHGDVHNIGGLGHWVKAGGAVERL